MQSGASDFSVSRIYVVSRLEAQLAYAQEDRQANAIGSAQE